MAYDLEEQESLAEIKAWWEKWGNLILTVVTVACLCAAGFQGWRWYQMKESTDAGVLYAQMIQASNMKDEAPRRSPVVFMKATHRRPTPGWVLCLPRITLKPPVNMQKLKKRSSGL
jgi:predicted negative regulator of RcsB-dependent stress response